MAEPFLSESPGLLLKVEEVSRLHHASAATRSSTLVDLRQTANKYKVLTATYRTTLVLQHVMS